MVIAGAKGLLEKERGTWGMDKEYNWIEIEGRKVKIQNCSDVAGGCGDRRV